MSVADAELILSDSKNGDDVSGDAKKVTLEFGKKHKDTLKADRSYLHVSANVKNAATGKPQAVQQVFLRLSKGAYDAVFALSPAGKKGYRASVEVHPRAHMHSSAQYSIQLTPDMIIDHHHTRTHTHTHTTRTRSTRAL